MSGATRPIVVMGVSGVGKTRIGSDLARRRGVDFVDADDLHGSANVAKMSAGFPLDDDDRWPWLDRVGAALRADHGVVVACSALRRRYRERLLTHAPSTLFVHLLADIERVQAHIEIREPHFMPSSLLRSQFQALEPLAPDEPGLRVIVDKGPTLLVDRVQRLLAMSFP